MHLERWMIDEIIDDDVRVLRAALRAGPVVDRVAEAFGAARSLEAPAARVEPNRTLALDLEAEPVEIWTRETEASFERGSLTAFLVDRAGTTAAPGLPVRSALREGDVYWVIDPTAGADGRRAAHDLDAPAAAGLLESLRATDVEVWDVTAAARQVMKRLYGDAAFARVDERSTAEGRDGG